MNVKRNIAELRSQAAMWWPQALLEDNAKNNIIPRLLETQDDFLRILLLAKRKPFMVFDLIKTTNFPANLFLKHLVILADYGGEPLQRLGRSFRNIFPKQDDQFYFDFTWNKTEHTYYFEALPVAGLGNKKLAINGEGLLKSKELDGLSKDVIAILLYAASSDVSELAGLDVCTIGTLLGDEEQLMRFVKQKYIVVSRITGGATANSLGQAAQTEVFNYLRQRLDDSFALQRNGSIYLSEYGKSGGMPFDIVVIKGKKKIGIEVSFQVTTNSTIERKSGQAADRANLIHNDGYFIAYVLDGAGNFQRSSALATICEYSDCTVAYTPEEFEVLARWIEELL